MHTGAYLVFQGSGKERAARPSEDHASLACRPLSPSSLEDKARETPGNQDCLYQGRPDSPKWMNFQKNSELLMNPPPPPLF